MNDSEKKTHQYLQKAILKGFRSIESTEANFQNGLNIIIGKNGSGKTNFLTFLDSALNLDFEDYNEFDATLHLKDIVKDEWINIHAWRNFLKKRNPVEKVILSKGEVKIETFSSKVPFINWAESKELEEPYYPFDLLTILTSLTKHGIPSEIPFISKPFNFGTKTLGNDTFNFLKNDEFPFFVKKILSHLFFEFGLFTAEKRNLNEYYVQRSSTTLVELMSVYTSNANEYLSKYTPVKAIRFSDRFSINIDENKEDILFNNLYFEYNINGSWLPFSSLSDGTKRILLIVTNLSIVGGAYFTKKNISFSENFSNTFLLEEPELGIHPHQLHLLMTFLKEQSRDKQIIITTHSPQVLDVLSADELNRITICSFVSGKGTQLRGMTEAEMEKAKQYMKEGYLSDYWRFSDFDRD